LRGGFSVSWGGGRVGAWEMWAARRAGRNDWDGILVGVVVLESQGRLWGRCNWSFDTASNTMMESEEFMYSN